MYIRRTHTNNYATGERYYTYQLVKSKYVGGSTLQSTELNLVRHFASKQNHWPNVCADRRDHELPVLALLSVECPLTVERESQRIAALLLARRGAPLASTELV